MEPNLENQLSKLEEKIDHIYISVEKTRKYFFWTLIITVALVILPLIGLGLIVPGFINNYTDSFSELGL